MFAHLAFAVERRRGPEHGIRFHQHLADIGQRLAPGIADPEQFLGIAKLGQQVGDVVHDLGIAQSDLLGIVPAHEFDEQLLQGMRFRNHLDLTSASKPRVTRGSTPYFVPST